MPVIKPWWHVHYIGVSTLGRRHAMIQVIRVLVVFGVGAIIGDGVLTPAISVLSSIEGLHEVATISQGKRLTAMCHLAFASCLHLLCNVIASCTLHTCQEHWLAGLNQGKA